MKNIYTKIDKRFKRYGIGVVEIAFVVIAGVHAEQLFSRHLGMTTPPLPEEHGFVLGIVVLAVIVLRYEYWVFRRNRKKLVRYFSGTPRNCPSCKYSLEGLSIPGLCPECGMGLIICATKLDVST